MVWLSWMPITSHLVRAGSRVGVGLGPGVNVGGIGTTRVLVGVGGGDVHVGGRVGVAYVVGVGVVAVSCRGVATPFAAQPGTKPNAINATRATGR